MDWVFGANMWTEKFTETAFNQNPVRDYSNNTLLHYAAAYGNMELVIYLSKVIDQIPNKKNFYPWEIAVLKGHIRCAQLLEMKEDKLISFPQHHHLIFLLLKNPRGT